ncbi:mechanosensitive ion channel [Rhodobacterales bacterium]|nr:mechanosensitive ion channel [Rhodobacterales bacterium]
MAAETNATTDRAIQRRIVGIYEELEGLGKISVDVKAGVVTLGGTVTEVALSERAVTLAERVDGVVAVNNEIVEETALSERLGPVYERLHDRTLQAFNYVPLMLVALFVWFVVGLIGVLIAGAQWPWDRVTPNAFVADLLRQLVRIVFIVMGAVLALDVLGATAVIGTLLGAAGIVGLAVGFAVRDTVENYIASIMLSIRQPFSPKDFIKIEGYEGNVIRLTSRATILMEPDGNHIRIPNSIVFKSTIINYTINPQRRFCFNVGVDADSDLANALQVGLDTIRVLPFVLNEPSPDAWIDNLGDSNVVLSFVGWIDQDETDFLRARSESMRLVKQALESSGFSLPEPIYRLRFDSDLPVSAKSEGAGAAEKASSPPPREPKTDEPKDTSVDRDLERRIDEEREATGSEDLLDESAPKEFGSRDRSSS